MNKINKILIGILLIFLTTVISTAVPVSTMNKILDISNAEGFALTNHDGYTYAGQNETVASISQTDVFGNVLWNKSYDENNGSYFSDIEVTLDVGYIAVGASSYELHDGDDNWLTSGLIVKVDEKGTEQWKTYVQEKNYLSFKKVDLIDNTGYIIVGDIMDYNGSPQSIYLTKIDMTGHVLWGTILTNDTDLDFSSDVHSAIDGGFVVTGSVNDGKDGIVIKVDTNGKKQWTKVLKGKGHASSIELYEGGYIVAGYLENEYPRSNNSWLMKINSKGKVKWVKTLNLGVHNEVNSVKVLNDGLILTGTIYKRYGSTDPNGGMLIKTDRRGNELWKIVPGDNTYSTLKDVTEIYEDRYEAFGYKCNVDTNECGVYFVRVEDYN